MHPEMDTWLLSPAFYSLNTCVWRVMWHCESHTFNSCSASWYQTQWSPCPLPFLKSKESEDPENESGSQVHWPYYSMWLTVKSETPEKAAVQQRQGRRALLNVSSGHLVVISTAHCCVRCTFKCRMPGSLQKSSCSPSASEAWDHKRRVVLLCPSLASHNNTAQLVLFYNTHIHPLHHRALRGFYQKPLLTYGNQTKQTNCLCCTLQGINMSRLLQQLFFL